MVEKMRVVYSVFQMLAETKSEDHGDTSVYDGSIEDEAAKHIC